jgi:hypothetical protein
MGKFVDHYHCRMTLYNGIDIHFGNFDAPVGQRFPGYDLQAFEQGFGLLSTVRFDNTHNDFDPLYLKAFCFEQHLVGFAYAGAVPEVNPQATALGPLYQA